MSEDMHGIILIFFLVVDFSTYVLQEKTLNKGTGLRPGKIRNTFYWSTWFASSDGTLIIWQIELNTKNSTKRQQSCRLVEFLVFNSAFGRHRH